MKLPQNYFENLSLARYREYLKLLPNMQKEQSRAVVMLIFSFIALSLLGIFAINPTLTTIITLQKQLDESNFVYQQLTTKMNNLSNLQEQYNALSNDLVYVFDAIPQNADAPKIVAQLYSIATKENVQITSITVTPILLSDPKQKQTVKTYASFAFALDATGSYDELMRFAKSMTNFNRIVTIESISMLKDQSGNSLNLKIQGREYFKK